MPYIAIKVVTTAIFEFVTPYNVNKYIKWMVRKAWDVPQIVWRMVEISYRFEDTLLSCPLLKIATWRYWLRLSRDVYDGNRSFASYTETKTVESDVWCLLTRLDDGEQSTGSKYLNMVQDQNSYFFFLTTNIE